jgi:hypothetical protein
MPWTTPKTWVAGSALTAAELNEQIRDNEQWIKDLLALYGMTSATLARSVQGAIAGVSTLRATDQTITDSTWTPILFTSEDFDSANGAGAGMHNNATNPERLIVPSGLAGYYQVAANIVWDTNTTGRRALRILLNGTTNIAVTRVSAVTGGTTGTGIYIGRLVSLAAGDYVQVDAYQDSGTSRTVDGTTFVEVPYFQMYRVGV